MVEELGSEFAEWRRRRAPVLAGDPLWRMTVYRLARFAADRAWADIRTFGADLRTRGIAGQLNGAIGSVPAHISEGYSRSSGPDRVRLYEYALGSARESRDWYLQGEPILGPARTALAVELLSRVIKLLLTLIPRERPRLIRPSDTPDRRAINSPDQVGSSVPTTQHAVRSTQQLYTMISSP